MSIGVWEPNGPESAESNTVSAEILAELLTMIEGNELDNLVELLGQKSASFSYLMKLEASAWIGANELADDALVQLIRFFTLAEMQLTGWDAGSKSPVIYLVKILKGRGGFDAELRKWVKASTDNRYLPYGSAL